MIEQVHLVQDDQEFVFQSYELLCENGDRLAGCPRLVGIKKE